MEDCIRDYYENEDSFISYIAYSKNITDLDDAILEMEYVEKMLRNLEKIGKYILLYELENGTCEVRAKMISKDSFAKYADIKRALKENLNLSHDDLKILEIEYPKFISEINDFEEFDDTLDVPTIYSKIVNLFKETLQDISEDEIQYLAYNRLQAEIFNHYDKYQRHARYLGYKNSIDYTLDKMGLTKKQRKNIIDIKNIRVVNENLVTFLNSLFNIENEITIDLVEKMMYSLCQNNKRVVTIDEQIEIVLRMTRKNFGEEKYIMIKDAIENGYVKIGGILKSVPLEDGTIGTVESNKKEGYVINLTDIPSLAYVDRNENVYGLNVLVHELGHLMKETTSCTKRKSIEKREGNILDEVPAILNQILTINELNISLETEYIIEFLNYIHFNFIQQAPIILTEMKLMKTKKYDIGSIYANNLDKINSNITEPSDKDFYEWIEFYSITTKLEQSKYLIGTIVAINIACRLQNDDKYISKYLKYLETEDLSNPVQVLKEVLDIDINDIRVINLGYAYICELIKSIQVI